MTDIHDDKILILDFGSQYTQLIARRVREAGVYCEIFPWDADFGQIRDFGARGFILSGGPESTLDAEKPEVPAGLFDLGLPILGICYGMQAIAQQLGGQVENVGKSEFGYASVRARGHTELLRDIQDHETAEGYGMLDVWMSHGDRVAEMPPGFKLMASTESAPIAGMADEERRIYGLQFHPEVTHTLQGKAIYARFLHQICGCGSQWTPANIIESTIAGCVNWSKPTRLCWGFPEAWILRWSRRCCTRRSAISSPVSSSIPACCVTARAIRSWSSSPSTWGFA